MSIFIGSPAALSATPKALTYWPSGPHKPTMAPGTPAAFIASVIAPSRRWATPGSMAFAAGGADGGAASCAQLDSSSEEAAMATRPRQRIVTFMEIPSRVNGGRPLHYPRG